MSHGYGPIHNEQGLVLRHLDLKIKGGSFHFLTGPSGAGKSTLLSLITHAIKPIEGSVSLFGERLDYKNRDQIIRLRRQTGIVFQDFRLLSHLNIFENAALPLRLAGQRLEDFDEDVKDLLSWVGLGHRLLDRPEQLSGGEKQRLAIARAVVSRPKLIIADEPTGNIDPIMAVKIMRLFVELNRLGATVLVASHDDALIEATKKPVLLLKDGQIIEKNAPKRDFLKREGFEDK